MLRELRISNLVLIESAEIAFKEGMNVLSGETGSGKSAIINSLSLIAGERTPQMIRRGCEKAHVEAVFDIAQCPAVLRLLEEAGIDHEVGDELIIKRELTAAGKSRAFVNHQLAQLALLRKIAQELFEIVGQHANQKLLSVEKHREILDLYGNLQEEVAAFSLSWENENRMRTELDSLVGSEAQRLREIEVCRMELEELEEAHIKEGEDDELFSEYSLLAHAEELTAKVNEINQTLSGERHAVIPQLNKIKGLFFEQLVKIDPSLADAAKSCENALLEIQELAYSLRHYGSKVEYNPERLREINDRLTLITRLKRKFGETLDEIRAYQAKAKAKLALLESADIRIEELRRQLEQAAKENEALTQQLTAERQKTAKKLMRNLVAQLRSLNMPKVDFIAEIAKQKRSRHGEDKVEFYLVPNVGEHAIPIKDCASGGELSRLLLALQALLAGKEQIPTLIFDEVDANIGGETATIVGQKLHEIGKKHQVLCITHFPQVAKQADHHLQISKAERKGRTLTQVQTLDEKARTLELERMLGG